MRRALLAAVLACSATLTACGGEDEKQTSKSDGVPRGGTLRVGITENDSEHELETIDPAINFTPSAAEIFRCCLQRTLVNYRGGTTEEGGSILRPDLATALPTASDDGLTYTFRLKPGLRYAPPYEDVTITSQDVVRAIEYALRLGPQYYTDSALVIEGAEDFQKRKATTISGLETPDERTLVVHLAEPVGDLAERFALPFTSPIPTGADVKGKKFDRVPASSGPYMIAGSAGFDFSKPPSPTRVPSGYVPEKRLVLVRNPSWQNDPIRKAYADRIVVSYEGKPEKADVKVDDGRLDVALGQFSPTLEQIARYDADPALRKRLYAHEGDSVRYINLNLAVPPFDDVHVRKAVNLAIDKQALVRAARAGLGGQVAGHIAPDALLNNLLLGYDPYATPGKSRRPEGCEGRARQVEVRPRRRRHVRRAGLPGPARARAGRRSHRRAPGAPRAGGSRPLGIELDVKSFDAETYFTKILERPESPGAAHPRARLGPGHPQCGQRLPAPLPLGPPPAPGGDTLSRVGATPRQLRGWGYTVEHTPNVDAKLDACLRLTASAQIQCWAETDQLLMETVVPWVPYLFEGTARTVSPRVAKFALTQSSFALPPSLDRIALKPGSG